MYLLLICWLGLALNSHLASAFEGQGKNPGDWKMMPVSIEKKSENYILRIRNLDSFAKLCTLKVYKGGEQLLFAPKQIFKADRSLELVLDLDAKIEIDLKDLRSQVACIKISSSAEEKDLPDPAELSCKLDKEDCEQICPADPSNQDSCKNDHLLVDFSRSSFKVTETEDNFEVEALFNSRATEGITCQFLMTATSQGVAGDFSYITAPTPLIYLETGNSQKGQWTFVKAEAGEGRLLDLSKPRVVGLCELGKVSKAMDWYRSCQPLKRQECNWVMPRGTIN